MKFSGKRVLVTGGAGFIGTRLVHELVRVGAWVRVFDDLSTGCYEGIGGLVDGGGVEFVRGDVCDEGAVVAACAGVDAVMHLAVMNLRSCMVDPCGAVSVNSTGTLNVCLGALGAGVGRFVYVSSSDVYGDVDVYPTPESVSPLPTTLYGSTKLAGEYITRAYAATHGLDAVVVRPFNTYGPGEHIAGPSGEVLPRFVLMALEGRALPVYGDGRQTRNFTHVDDTVRGILMAAGLDDAPDGPVNVASGEEISVLEAAEMVLEACGSSSGVEHLPGRPGDVWRQFADTSLARGLMGYEAEISFRDGLPGLVEWVRGSGLSADDIPKLWPGGK